MPKGKLKAVSVMKKMEARELFDSIHPFAQRRIVRANLERLKREFDLDAIGVIHAVQYEIKGRLAVWVIDGQTRITALKELDLGDWVVDVKVHLDATDDRCACALFLKLNHRAPVSPYDKFLNELTSEMPEAVGVTGIIKSHGLMISRNGGDGLLVCISALKKVFRRDGGKSLSAALRVITEAWGSRSAALEGKIIDGISILIRGYKTKLEIPSLVSVLSKYPGGPSALVGDARGVADNSKAPLSRCVAHVVINQYNRNRRTGKLAPLSGWSFL
jgi:hypothetical protein